MIFQKTTDSIIYAFKAYIEKTVLKEILNLSERIGDKLENIMEMEGERKAMLESIDERLDRLEKLANGVI